MYRRKVDRLEDYVAAIEILRHDHVSRQERLELFVLICIVLKTTKAKEKEGAVALHALIRSPQISCPL